MKKILYVLCAASLAFALASCYEDKGHYDHREINDVEIEFSEESYYAVSLVDDLTIVPNITTRNGSESDLEYVWAITPSYTPSSSTSNTEQEIVPDTISRSRDLNYPIALDPGEYFVYYRVDNTATGISYYKRADLTVTTSFSKGLYLLKEINGNTDVDLHYWEKDKAQSEVDAPIYNIITNLHETPISGTPESYGITYQYCYLDENGEYTTSRTLNIGAGGDMRVYNPETWNLVLSHSDGTLFWGDRPTETPIYLRGHYFGVSYISDKGHYFSYQAPEWGMVGGGKFGYPDVELEGGMTPNPNVLMMNAGNPSLNFHDEKNNRLVAIDYNGSSHTYAETSVGGINNPYSPNNIPHKLIFNGGNAMAKVYTQLMIFTDKDDPTQRYLYHLELNAYNNPIKNIVTFAKDSKMNQATMYAVNETDAMVMYFIYNNSLYLYDLGTGAETLLSPAGMGTGEQINYLAHRWYSGTTGESFNYLAIGTTSGGNYKVYLYNMIGARPNGNPAYTLQGEGKAFGLHYISPAMNTMNTHGNYSWGRW